MYEYITSNISGHDSRIGWIHYFLPSCDQEAVMFDLPIHIEAQIALVWLVTAIISFILGIEYHRRIVVKAQPKTDVHLISVCDCETCQEIRARKAIQTRSERLAKQLVDKECVK